MIDPAPLLADTTRVDWSCLPAAVACVDVGGTKVAVSVADTSGPRAQRTEPTARTGTPLALAEQILRLVVACADEAQLPLAQIVRVGVSSCGPFVSKAGCVELAAPNICGGLAGPARGLPNDWLSAPLEAPLRAQFERWSGAATRVRVENDGIAALEAERRWGALRQGGRALDHCAYVTWSTGIGVGLCVDGHVLRGKSGNAGHAGHTYVSTGVEALCGCGNLGDVESLVAGNALGRRFAAEGYADAQALFAAARAGDEQAVRHVDGLCTVLGRMLYNITATLDLQRISMGGSVFWHQRDLLLPKLQAELARHMPPLTLGCELVAAGLELRVGDFAALALVMD
jgi:glucokinase